ncbi:MAG: DUF3857 domain-containing protein [Flavobacteriales bacterium]|nr:DUF3857 domain-containing protein [Flavobacteriales bacterium]
MRLAIILLALATGLPLAAQHKLLTEYDWDPKPTVPDSLRKGADSDVLLKRNILGQYDNSGQDLAYFEVFHLQRYLHDQASVDASKTIELGAGHIERVIRIKARSVNPDGKVHELGEDAFKRGTDERDNSSVLYFAFEGLQPGSIIEYLMLCKQSSDVQGDLTRLQFSIPVAEQRFEVLVPEGWRFAFKGYNGVPLPELDSSLAGVRRHHLTLHGVPAMEEERSAEANRYRKYIVAKLDAIPERSLRDISGYTPATRNYHKSLYPDLEKGTKKSLAAVLKKMGLSFARDEEDRIRTMVQYVRTNFRMAETGGGKLADLDEIMRTGTCNKFGLQRLYANLLREAGIEHQLVVTSSRDESPFDREFEAHNYLRTLTFYFPGPDKFFDPAAAGLGLGYLEPENMGTHGLFIKNVELNGLFAGVGSVKRIPELPAESTRHDLVLTIAPNEDGSECTIDIENRLSGYYANFIQNFWSFFDTEQQVQIIGNHQKHLIEGATEHKILVENAEQRYFGVKPFIFRGSVTTPLYTNRAGEDVLLKVGDLIGPQMEMYQEKARKLPVDDGFNRYYDRRITVKVPKGWAVTDLAPMSIHKTLEIDGKVQAEFKSSATQKDGEITVEVIEYYRTTHVPLEHYEAYRAVINAAADFNKRNLLLHPAKD